MRRAGAGLGLAAILAGVPVALLSLLGPPRTPSFAGSEGLSGSYVPVEAILEILGILAWGLWAYLVFAIFLNVLAEVAAMRGMPAGGVLLAASALLTPRVVRRLVELALGGVFVAASISGNVEFGGPVSEASTVATTSAVSPATAVKSSSPQVPEQATYRVRPGDSLWRIAERELGSGFRWRKIFEHNRGQRFPNGEVLTNPHLIYPGWELELPKLHESVVPDPGVDEASVPPPPNVHEVEGTGAAPGNPVPSLTPTASLDASSETVEIEDPEPEPARKPVLTLPSGLVVAASFASGMLSAHLLGRLRRRRRRRLSVHEIEEPEEPQLAADMRRAGASAMAGRLEVALDAVAQGWTASGNTWPSVYMAVERDRQVTVLVSDDGDPVPPPSGGTVSPLVRFARRGAFVQAEVSGPFPTMLRPAGTPMQRGLMVPLGSTAEGAAVHAGLLAGGPVSIAGQRFADLVRQMILAATARASPEDLELILLGVAADLEHLARLPHVTSSCGWEAASVPLREVQTEFVRRARLFLDEGLENVSGHVAELPEERLPSLLLVAGEPPAALRGLLEALGQEASRHGASLLAAGWDPAGAWLRAGVESDGSLRTQLPGAESLGPFLLSAEDAEDAIEIVAEAHPREKQGKLEEEPTEDIVEPPLVVEQAPPLVRIVTEVPEEPTEQGIGSDELTAAPSSPPDVVTFRCLGPLQISRDGRRLRKGWRAKSIELIAYLVANPAGASRDRIIEELWPEIELEQASELFYAATSTIRRRLRSGDDSRRFVDREGEIFRLQEGELWVDAWEFERLIKDAEHDDDSEVIEKLRDAVALYRGDFCAEHYYPWADVMREHIRALFVQACARLADLLSEEREQEEALSVLDRAVKADPVSEDLSRRAMMIDASLGRRAAALARYRKLETRLDKELSVEPDPETQALARQLQREEADSRAGG